MMLLDVLSNFSRRELEADALYLHGNWCSYAELKAVVDDWRRNLPCLGILPGQTVALSGSLSLSMIAALIALEDRGAIVLPIMSDSGHEDELEAACIDVVIKFGSEGHSCVRRQHTRSNGLLQEFREHHASAGLMFLTSGSTQRSKIVLHDFRKLIQSILPLTRKPSRMIIFLMMDHIGGMNSLLHVLCNAGAAVFAEEKTVASVCQLIEQTRADVLPTTPTFLRMMSISSQLSQYDLSSLRTITYGTEPIHASTLEVVSRILPKVRLKQTYGMTESGILPTKSKCNDSVWMKVGGRVCDTKIVDGILCVRPPASMVGYLNEKSIVDREGWINTGDQVEVDGDYLRILGRASEIINVAGEKVYPSQVESAIMALPNVLDVTVTARRNALTGEVVEALVRTEHQEEPAALQRRIRAGCRLVLRPAQVPAIVLSTSAPLHGSRFKKLRGHNAPAVPQGDDDAAGCASYSD